ncbi:hypothetical protein ANANG_G00131960 [Anguilla anguilla]|uniref:Paralemmin-1 n=1 Tax=Anguilla anguilla TaxID=7936 RepID=A0A9D3MG01_ANGAN|nr:hypothetical protein ANANG_G00131960 [Anguilla anguilla]
METQSRTKSAVVEKMSEAQAQQERLQVIAEKKKWQMEVENKKRQLEDERRQLQHLKSKALRERWLLDGAPSAGQEEGGARKQLQEDEAKTQSLEKAILSLEQELEELETGVSATSTKEGRVEIRKEGPGRLADGLKVTPTDSVKVVHEMRGTDSALESGVRLLSSSEVEDLIHKADVADAAGVAEKVGVAEKEGVVEKEGMAVEGRASPREREGAAAPPVGGVQTPRKEITGLQSKPAGGDAPGVVGGATTENPVSMVFMGYQDVEDEAETKRILGLEGTVKAELVHIEDRAPKDQPAPSNGSAAEVRGPCAH